MLGKCIQTAFQKQGFNNAVECYSIEDKREFLVSQYYKGNDSILLLPALKAKESCVVSGYYVYSKMSRTFLNARNILVFSNKRTFEIQRMQHGQQR